MGDARYCTGARADAVITVGGVSRCFDRVSDGTIRESDLSSSEVLGVEYLAYREGRDKERMRLFVDYFTVVIRHGE